MEVFPPPIQPDPPGRPSDYNIEIAAKICEGLAQGISLRTVCKAEGMPHISTVFVWIQKHKEFAEQYARAKEESADAMSEDMLDIADDGSNDWISVNDPENPGYKANGEHIQRSRLRIDTRKWLASKLKPKKYGDKVEQTHRGDPTAPVVISHADADL